MSGKFKRDVARSQTLSQISCFSGQIDVQDQYQDEDIVNSKKSSLSQVADSKSSTRSSRTSFNIETRFHHKKVDFTKLSPCKSSHLSNALMQNLEISENAHSDYNLENSISVDQYSKEFIDLENSIAYSVKKAPLKESLFKQNSSTVQVSISSQDEFNNTNLSNPIFCKREMDLDNLCLLDLGKELDGSCNIFAKSGDSINSAQIGKKSNQQIDAIAMNLKNSTHLNNKTCSIIYTSCQVDINCSTSLKIMNENRREMVRNINIDSSSNTSQSFPLDSINLEKSNQEMKNEIIREFTEASISKINYINSKIMILESVLSQSIERKYFCKARRFINKKLRVIKKAPFTSVSCVSGKITDFQIFQTNVSSLIQLRSHYLIKIYLDIDALRQKDICLNTEESYSFVLPLDSHFPNVIMIGTLSGKILLYALTQDAPRKYSQKFKNSIFQSGEFGICCCQSKDKFIIGSNDGSLIIFDFKKKIVTAKVEAPNEISVRNDYQEEKDENKIKGISVKSIEQRDNMILTCRYNGTIELRNFSAINEVIFEKKIDNLVKCAFSCDNFTNIVIQSDNTLKIIYFPSEKIVFSKTLSLQEFMEYKDMTMNYATKEIIALSTHQLLHNSKIEIFKNSSTKLRTIDTLNLNYLLDCLLLDKQQNNLFCVGQNNIKLWQFYNQQESVHIKSVLLEKFNDDSFEELTTNESITN